MKTAWARSLIEAFAVSHRWQRTQVNTDRGTHIDIYTDIQRHTHADIPAQARKNYTTQSQRHLRTDTQTYIHPANTDKQGHTRILTDSQTHTCTRTVSSAHRKTIISHTDFLYPVSLKRDAGIWMSCSFFLFFFLPLLFPLLHLLLPRPLTVYRVITEAPTITAAPDPITAAPALPSFWASVCTTCLSPISICRDDGLIYVGLYI